MQAKYLIDQVSPQWLRTLLEVAAPDRQYLADELRTLALEAGVDLKKRNDVFNRLVDTEAMAKENKHLRLTPLGQQFRDVAIRDERLVSEYMHQWHHARGGLPDQREYFTAYRLLINAYWHDPSLSTAAALSIVQDGMYEAYPAATGAMGIDSGTIGKGLVFWRDITGGDLALRAEVAPSLVLHAIQLVLWRRGLGPTEPLLLSEPTIEELCQLLLLNRNTFDTCLQRTLRLASTRIRDKFSLAGTSVILSGPITMA